MEDGLACFKRDSLVFRVKITLCLNYMDKQACPVAQILFERGKISFTHENLFT